MKTKNYLIIFILLLLTPILTLAVNNVCTGFLATPTEYALPSSSGSYDISISQDRRFELSSTGTTAFNYLTGLLTFRLITGNVTLYTLDSQATNGFSQLYGKAVLDADDQSFYIATLPHAFGFTGWQIDKLSYTDPGSIQDYSISGEPPATIRFATLQGIARGYLFYHVIGAGGGYYEVQVDGRTANFSSNPLTTPFTGNIIAYDSVHDILFTDIGEVVQNLQSYINTNATSGYTLNTIAGGGIVAYNQNYAAPRLIRTDGKKVKITSWSPFTTTITSLACLNFTPLYYGSESFILGTTNIGNSTNPDHLARCDFTDEFNPTIIQYVNTIGYPDNAYARNENALLNDWLITAGGDKNSFYEFANCTQATGNAYPVINATFLGRDNTTDFNVFKIGLTDDSTNKGYYAIDTRLQAISFNTPGQAAPIIQAFNTLDAIATPQQVTSNNVSCLNRASVGDTGFGEYLTYENPIPGFCTDGCLAMNTDAGRCDAGFVRLGLWTPKTSNVEYSQKFYVKPDGTDPSNFIKKTSFFLHTMIEAPQQGLTYITINPLTTQTDCENLINTADTLSSLSPWTSYVAAAGFIFPPAFLISYLTPSQKNQFNIDCRAVSTPLPAVQLANLTTGLQPITDVFGSFFIEYHYPDWPNTTAASNSSTIWVTDSSGNVLSTSSWNITHYNVVNASINFTAQTTTWYLYDNGNTLIYSYTQPFTRANVQDLTYVFFNNRHVVDQTAYIDSYQYQIGETPVNIITVPYRFFGDLTANTLLEKVIMWPVYDHSQRDFTARIYATDETHGLLDYTNYVDVNFSINSQTPIYTANDISALNNGTSPSFIKGDVVTDLLPSFLDTIGLRSIGSRILLGFVLLVILTLILSSFGSEVIIFSDIVFMMVLTYLGLFPAWFTVLLVVTGAGIFAMAIKRTAG